MKLRPHVLGGIVDGAKHVRNIKTLINFRDRVWRLTLTSK